MGTSEPAKPSPPVLVVGGTRSGTTMLCRILGRAPGHCLWYEPNIIWRIGSAYRPDDAADETNAKPWVIRRLHRLFARYQAAHGGDRVVEKTPMNVLRMTFLHAVFPDAPILHIYRDGRANLRSQLEKFERFKAYNVTSGNSIKVIKERLGTTPFWEWPAYVPRAADGLFRRYITKKQVGWWGLRYPGWKADRKRLTPTQIAAKQWVVAVTTARHELADIPNERWLEIRYEDLVTDPAQHFATIAEFLRMDSDCARAFIDDACATVSTGSLTKWAEELDPAVIAEAMPVMGPLLVELGYLTEQELDTLSSPDRACEHSNS